ncbi:hypothetical protein [Pseudomonas sp. URMO17WK12:I12]
MAARKARRRAQPAQCPFAYRHRAPDESSARPQCSSLY